MYNKILVAYDGSEGSKAALDHAAEIAALHHSTLILTHAMKEKRSASSRQMNQFPYGTAEVGGAPVADYTEQESTSEREKAGFLLKKAKNNLSLPSSHVETEVLYGEQPAREICDYASFREADLIVMGNRGLHGFRKLMLGSVSQKVAQNAHCPVLIVK